MRHHETCGTWWSVGCRLGLGTVMCVITDDAPNDSSKGSESTTFVPGPVVLLHASIPPAQAGGERRNATVARSRRAACDAMAMHITRRYQYIGSIVDN